MLQSRSRTSPRNVGVLLAAMLMVACTSSETQSLELEPTAGGKAATTLKHTRSTSEVSSPLRIAASSNQARSTSPSASAIRRQPVENMALAAPASAVVVEAPAEMGSNSNESDDSEPVVDSGLEPLAEENELAAGAVIDDLEDAPPAIENAFGLCDGSIYVAEWSRQFDERWRRENNKRYKRVDLARKAMNQARSTAFLQLLVPVLKGVESDFPIAVNADVLKWINFFQTRGRNAFVTWLRRAQDVVPKITPVLEEHGLPKDLVYLAMIESGFNNRALSTAKAVGTWQFIPGTGRRYGLRIDDYVDERRDPAKSARAASQYLTDLYSMFGDWHLAAASYNAGEGRVGRALRRLDGGFFDLTGAGRLPQETANYVPKIIAAS